MNEQQEAALRLLKFITPKTVRGRVLRERTLLPYGKELTEGYRDMPEDGFCEGWAYTVGPHFASSLDIILQPRKRNKKTYHAWTQGSLFNFRVGYTFYSSDKATLVQITESKPANPATEETRREPGEVKIQMYTAGNQPGTWEVGRIFRATQDEFIAFLINGSVPGLKEEA